MNTHFDNLTFCTITRYVNGSNFDRFIDNRLKLRKLLVTDVCV